MHSGIGACGVHNKQVPLRRLHSFACQVRDAQSPLDMPRKANCDGCFVPGSLKMNAGQLRSRLSKIDLVLVFRNLLKVLLNRGIVPLWFCNIWAMVSMPAKQNAVSFLSFQVRLHSHPHFKRLPIPVNCPLKGFFVFCFFKYSRPRRLNSALPFSGCLLIDLL